MLAARKIKEQLRGTVDASASPPTAAANAASSATIANSAAGALSSETATAANYASAFGPTDILRLGITLDAQSSAASAPAVTARAADSAAIANVDAGANSTETANAGDTIGPAIISEVATPFGAQASTVSGRVQNASERDAHILGRSLAFLPPVSSAVDHCEHAKSAYASYIACVCAGECLQHVCDCNH